MTIQDTHPLLDFTPRTWTAEERLQMAAQATSASLNLEGFTTTPDQLLTDRAQLHTAQRTPR